MSFYAPWINHLSVWQEQDGWVCIHGIKKGVAT